MMLIAILYAGGIFVGIAASVVFDDYREVALGICISWLVVTGLWLW